MAQNRKGTKKSTIYDVALEANVAPSTVSNVLNGTAGVSEKTRQKVLEVIRKKEYHPNIVARNLRSQCTRIIGVIIQDLTSEYYSLCMAHLLEQAQKNDYVVFIGNSHFKPEITAKNVATMIERQADGIVFIGGTKDEECIHTILNQGIPVVLGDRYDPELPCVEFNNFETMRRLVHSLTAEGFRRLAYVGEPPQTQQNLKQRYEGFLQGLADEGIPREECCILLDEQLFRINKMRKSFDVFTEYLKNTDAGKWPQAVFTSNDMIAQNVIHTSTQFGLQIPEDMWIVGFDNTSHSYYSIPSATTVAQDPRLLADTCFSMIKNEIEKKDAQKHIMLKAQVVIRESAPIAPYLLEREGLEICRSNE